jgi:ketosteroid isomerase-like protein
LLRLWSEPHRITEGEIVGFENVAQHGTPELAYIVEVERYQAKVGGREGITPVAVRVTTIFRPEDGTWKVVHRHADPITTAQPAESVLQE